MSPSAPSKLSSFCAGVMEAAWLAALVLVPLCCSPDLARPFDTLKVVLVRSIALIMSGAWLVRLVDQQWAHHPNARNVLGAFLRTPLAVPVAIFALAYVLATLLSVDATTSFWGSYNRLQGTFTVLCYLVIFASVAAYLRRQEQVERLVTTALATSLPLALYGILQRGGYDPIVWLRTEYQDRVVSLIGGPVFLGAYLGMVWPLSVWQIVRLSQALRQSSEGRRLKLAALVFYVLLALIQLFTLLLTQSRGPFLGWLVSLALMCFLFATYWKRRLLLIAPIGVCVLVLGFFIWLSVPGSPLRRLSSRPILERFSEVFSTQTGTGAYRTLLWQHAPKLLFASEPVSYPDGRTEQHPLLRFLLGYGPENLDGVLTHSYSSNADRFHNLVWDLSTSIGAVGFAVFLSIIVLIFFYGYRRLGLLPSRRENLLFLGTIVAITVGSTAGFVAVLGVSFGGLGLQLGLVAGLAIYPLFLRLLKGTMIQPGSPIDRNRALLIAVLAALAGDIIETGFSFHVDVTYTLFWIYAGIVVALCTSSTGMYTSVAGLAQRTALEALPGSTEKPRKRPVQVKGRGNKRADPWPIVVSAVITTTILVPIIFAFVRWSPDTAAWDILSHSLTQVTGREGTYAGVILLLLAVWMGAAFALTVDIGLPGRSGPWNKPFLSVLVISGAAAGIFAFVKAMQLAGVNWLVGGSGVSTALKRLAGYEHVYLVFIVVLIALLLLNAAACSRLSPQAHVQPARAIMPVGILVLGGTLAVAYGVNSKLVRSDLALSYADALYGSKDWDPAFAIYERAIQIERAELFYRFELASKLADQAKAASDHTESATLRRAEQILLETQTPALVNSSYERLSNFHRATRNLANFYTAWASHESEPGLKMELARKASQACERALVFDPHNANFWHMSAYLDLTMLNQEATGLKKYQRAAELDPNKESLHSLLGDHFAAKSRSAQDKTDRTRFARQAIGYYLKAAEVSQEPSVHHNSAVKLCAEIGEPELVVLCYREARDAAKPAAIWRAETALALVYHAMQNKAAALEHLQEAIEKAPLNHKSRLLRLKKQIQQGP